MKRFVLYGDVVGVYLGSAMGLGFWSKLDPVGQSSACTFDSKEAVDAFVAHGSSSGEPILRKYSAVEVEVEAPGRYASISECVAAGLPAWEPR